MFIDTPHRLFSWLKQPTKHHPLSATSLRQPSKSESRLNWRGFARGSTLSTFSSFLGHHVWTSRGTSRSCRSCGYAGSRRIFTCCALSELVNTFHVMFYVLSLIAIAVLLSVCADAICAALSVDPLSPIGIRVGEPSDVCGRLGDHTLVTN